MLNKSALKCNSNNSIMNSLMKLDLTARDIVSWLKGMGRNRAWLAENCGVQKRTVDNWLSSNRPIPQKALLIVQGMMGAQSDLESIEEASQQNLVLHFSEAEFESICHIARLHSTSPRKWVEAEIHKIIHSEPYKILRMLDQAEGGSAEAESVSE